MNRQELLLLTTTAFGAAAFGFLVGDRDRVPPPLASVQSASVSLDPLIKEIRKLGDLMLDLREQRAARASSPRTALSTQASDPSPPDVARLLERCAVLIKHLEARGSTSANQTPPLFTNSPSANPEYLLNFPDLDEELGPFYRAHQLWTFQQVLDRYGPPSEIINRDNGSIHWTYTIPGQDGEDRDWAFTFAEGYVIATDIW